MLEHTTISTSILAKIDNDRLQKGVEGLASGAYTITLTRLTEAEVSAYVTNGDSKTYSVTLTEGRSFCGCGDSMHRAVMCKYQVALALYVIRTPHAIVKDESRPTEEPKPLNLSLAKVRRSTT